MMVGRLMLPMLIFYWPLHSIDHRPIGILSAILDKRSLENKKFKLSNWAIIVHIPQLDRKRVKRLQISKLDKVDKCLARYSPRAEANNGTMQNDTVQYNATSCNTMQYHTIPMQYHKIYQCNTIRYTNAIP